MLTFLKKLFAQTWVTVVAWILVGIGGTTLIIKGFSTDTIQSFLTLVGTAVAAVVAVISSIIANKTKSSLKKAAAKASELSAQLTIKNADVAAKANQIESLKAQLQAKDTTHKPA